MNLRLACGGHSWAFAAGSANGGRMARNGLEWPNVASHICPFQDIPGQSGEPEPAAKAWEWPPQAHRKFIKYSKNFQKFVKYLMNLRWACGQLQRPRNGHCRHIVNASNIRRIFESSSPIFEEFTMSLRSAAKAQE